MKCERENKELAILVPAWKPKYLHQALSSISSQSCQDFECFVFDDAGPEEIKKISSLFPSFHYHRFNDNLGQISLVRHLNRCLEKFEHDWVWIFSDDDVMSQESVASFYAARKKFPDVNVFQVPVEMVSEDLERVIWTTLTPHWETAESFLEARLNSKRLSCMPDHIFSWAKLKSLNGGLVEFPLAWNSDDATWLLLGMDNGLACVDGAKVLWRQSNVNISATGCSPIEKLDADVQFLKWLKKNNLKVQPSSLELVFLARRMVVLYKIGYREYLKVVCILPLKWKLAAIWALLHRLLMRFNINLMR